MMGEVCRNGFLPGSESASGRYSSHLDLPDEILNLSSSAEVEDEILSTSLTDLVEEACGEALDQDESFSGDSKSTTTTPSNNTSVTSSSDDGRAATPPPRKNFWWQDVSGSTLRGTQWIPSMTASTTASTSSSVRGCVYPGFHCKDPVFKELSCNSCTYTSFGRYSMVQHIKEKHDGTPDPDSQGPSAKRRRQRAATVQKGDSLPSTPTTQDPEKADCPGRKRAEDADDVTTSPENVVIRFVRKDLLIKPEYPAGSLTEDTPQKADCVRNLGGMQCCIITFEPPLASDKDWLETAKVLHQRLGQVVVESQQGQD